MIGKFKTAVQILALVALLGIPKPYSRLVALGLGLLVFATFLRLSSVTGYAVAVVSAFAVAGD